MNEIEQYYNKFCEDKRLLSRHGTVEYVTSMKYIHECLKQYENPSILDVGAGTGRYSVALAEQGYDVTAVELVKYNLGILKSKKSSVKAFQGTAVKLSRFGDESFDLTLVFGPMYHLFTFEEKLQALREAKRVTKKGGTILVAYCMNEYAVITHAFKERHILEDLKAGKLDENFRTQTKTEDLYSYVRTEDIAELDEAADLERVKIISADSAADFMRPFLNALSEEEFQEFIRYHLSICERGDILGASAHTLDILRRK
ncbi:MAG: methyltransferase domain-containing protein [Hespellia sp.]|nr:methyltransferase domain-containing protein [Hespellia sp.]